MTAVQTCSDFKRPPAYLVRYATTAHALAARNGEGEIAAPSGCRILPAV